MLTLTKSQRKNNIPQLWHPVGPHPERITCVKSDKSVTGPSTLLTAHVVGVLCRQQTLSRLWHLLLSVLLLSGTQRLAFGVQSKDMMEQVGDREVTASVYKKGGMV